MASYIVGNVNVTDTDTYKQYSSQVQATLDLYGGKFLIRGSQPETLEGSWQPNRLVVIEFESLEQARRWYDSPEYAAIKPIRQKASIGTILLLEGYQP